MNFDDEFLGALGAWQKGWRENQELRIQLGTLLKRACMALPAKYRAVSQPCFRKRFLSGRDFSLLILNGFLEDGLTSWTVDRHYAEIFKGLYRENEQWAAVFTCDPHPDDVILSIPALWEDNAFNVCVENYIERCGPSFEALKHFRDSQGEVILDSQMLLQDLVAVTGESSPFEQLCDRAGIPDATRDYAWKKLVDANNIPQERRYLRDQKVQDAVNRVREAVRESLCVRGIDPDGPGAMQASL